MVVHCDNTGANRHGKCACTDVPLCTCVCVYECVNKLNSRNQKNTRIRSRLRQSHCTASDRPVCPSAAGVNGSKSHLKKNNTGRKRAVGDGNTDNNEATSACYSYFKLKYLSGKIMFASNCVFEQNCMLLLKSESGTNSLETIYLNTNQKVV